ncbi:DUF3316 domain-containing protein [Vibrio mexicanus]|uniref:DUF3316 domain-containing protein n=1 Tax=Vibrio mexicanus TaxID=1004326 RepID=UPI00063CE7A3|nr:DUF3316 domain-containing protein [Vibrio mexicanus]
MNKLTTILLTSALVMSGSQALAHPLHVSHEGNKTLATESVDSKESAYENAQLILDELKASSPAELKNELGVMPVHLVNNSVTLKDDSYIVAQEYMNDDGEVRYKGLVNVSYSYLKAENNR